MSPDVGTKDGKRQFWAVIIAAIIAAIASIIVGWPSIKVYLSPPVGKKNVNGRVYNSKTKLPLDAVVLVLQTSDGKPVKQATTDGEGRFSIEIPAELTDIRVAATKTGYFAYEHNLPATDSSLNNISLDRMPISIGIPDKSPLWQDLNLIAGKLNVAVVFSGSCTQKARAATVSGAELQADPDTPEVVMQALLDRVKENKARYGVTTIEPRGRYEITCF